MLSRRRLLAESSAALACGAARLGHAAPPPALYAAGRIDPVRGHAFVSGFDGEGRKRFDVPLPARCHGFAQRLGTAEIAVFARRPGRYVLVLDGRTGAVLGKIVAVSGRRFCGHGVYAAAGRLLYATELDVESGEGRIGVYDAANGYARVGEFASGGLDPHEIALLPGGRALVVANGGILTDPDTPGAKLNLHEMDSCLAVLRATNGTLLHTARLPAVLHQLSLRHLAVRRDGAIAVAMQYEGPRRDRVPLLALYWTGGDLAPLSLPDEALVRLRNYCGSVAFDAMQTVIGATSPAGGAALLWDMTRARVLGTVDVDDGCAIAADTGAGAFLIGSGAGGIFRAAPSSAGAVATSPLADGSVAVSRWDNHMLRLTPTLSHA